MKELNPFVTHTHLNMDSFKDMVRLVQPRCFFMTIDFQDAFYSVYVGPEERCWLLLEGPMFYIYLSSSRVNFGPPDFTKFLQPWGYGNVFF